MKSTADDWQSMAAIFLPSGVKQCQADIVSQM